MIYLLQRAKKIFSHYGVLLQPWLCVVAYIWGLELQAVYGTGFEPLLDRLASAALLLWTLIFWAALFSAGFALGGLFWRDSALRRVNESVCRAGCLLATGYFLNRWLEYWQPAEEKSNLTCWLLIVAAALLYFTVRQRRIKAGTPSTHVIPTWHDCFCYVVSPVLVISVIAVGGKIANSVTVKNQAMASIGGSPARAGARKALPNVIVIVSDSLRAQSMSLYGHSGKITPYIEQFAESSTVYLNMHANSTTTVPSLLSILSGKHPLSHGRLNRELPPQPDQRNLMSVLREHGYATAAVTSNGDASLASLGLAGALTEPEVMAFRFHMFSWLRRFGVYPTRFSGRMYQDLAAIMPFLAFPRRASADGNVVDTLAAATELISRLDKPFFLFIHIHEPHDPHDIPADFKSIPIAADREGAESNTGLHFYSYYAPEFQPVVDAYRSLYEAAIRSVDSELSKFLKSLQGAPWFGNSLVILMADHGESFERGYFYYGEELYENSTWIPLVIRFPGQRRGERVPGVIQPLDIAPSVLNALQIAVPDWLEGQPLKPETLPAPAATIAINYRHPDKNIVYYLPTKLAVWWNQYKLIASCETGKSVLYDLKSDPEERIDVSAWQPAVADDLKRRLKSQLSRQSREPRMDCPNL